MKKIFFALLMLVFNVSLFAQPGHKSGHIHVGYQSEYKRVGIGFQGRYGIVEGLRVAPDVTFYLPKRKLWGVDINIDMQYAFNVAPSVQIYPLAGLNMSNNRVSGDGFTNWGFNLGAGVDYNFSRNNYLNFEAKYTLSDWDYAQFMFGYGFFF